MGKCRSIDNSYLPAITNYYSPITIYYSLITMKILDWVQTFYQLDQQFGLLLERLQRFEKEYKADTVPHATIELLVKELGGYLSIVDQEILSAVSKREQATKLENPMLVAESDLLIQRLTLTRNSLSHYADRLAGLPIYGSEIFEHQYTSLEQISADEELTTKTMSLVNEYVEHKKNTPFQIDLDNEIEQQMEQHEHSIQLHNTYLLSINNMLDTIYTQTHQIEQLTQGLFKTLQKHCRMNRKKNYTIDSLDIAKTDFYTDYQIFLGHSNELIEGLLLLDTIKDKLVFLISCPFGQGKQYQSDFVDLLEGASFVEVLTSCNQRMKTIQLDYLVSLYTQCNLLRSASYHNTYIWQELVKTAVQHIDQHQRLDSIHTVLEQYDQLNALSALDTTIPQWPGRRNRFDKALQAMIEKFAQDLDTAWQGLIENIQSQDIKKSELTSLQDQADHLMQILTSLRETLALISQADQVFDQFGKQDLGSVISSIKKDVNQQRNQLWTSFVNTHQTLHDVSLDEHGSPDLLKTVRAYTQEVLSVIKQMNQIGDETQAFHQDLASIWSSISKADRYTYSNRDSLNTVKKNLRPQLNNTHLQALLPQIEAYIANKYTQAYQSHQTRILTESHQTSGGWTSGGSRPSSGSSSSGSSWSSGGSGSSWSSSSGSFWWGGSFSSSGGTSW